MAIITVQRSPVQILTRAASDLAGWAASASRTPAIDLEEPVWSGAAGQVTHFYDNFAGYTGVSGAGWVGSNPAMIGASTLFVANSYEGDIVSDHPESVDGGQAVNFFYTCPANPDFPTQYLAGSCGSRGMQAGSPQFVNTSPAPECVIVEWDHWEAGSQPFEGKGVDTQVGGSAIARLNFDFETLNSFGYDGSGGLQCVAHCDSGSGTFFASEDPLLSLYYVETFDGSDIFTLTSLGSSLGVIPSPNRSGGRGGVTTAGIWAAPEDPTGLSIPNPPEPGCSYPNLRYKQNRNYGTSSGQFALNNYDTLGLGRTATTAGLMRTKLKYTMNPPGDPYGYGRIEMWHGPAGNEGSLVKVMEFLGEAGAREEGMVYAGPRTRGFLTTNWRFYFVASGNRAQNILAEPTMSKIRIWSMPAWFE